MVNTICRGKTCRPFSMMRLMQPISVFQGFNFELSSELERCFNEGPEKNVLNHHEPSCSQDGYCGVGLTPRQIQMCFQFLQVIGGCFLSSFQSPKFFPEMSLRLFALSVFRLSRSCVGWI